MNIHAFTSFLIAPLRPQCEPGKRRYAILLSWILPLFIGGLLVSQLCLLWTPRLVLAEEPETITVTERKDYPDGLRIPQWNGSNGAFLYCGDELNKRGANYGDTLTVMNPRDYHDLRTADGLHNGSYSEYQLKALDYILYHGARGDRSESPVYGIPADWRAREVTQFAIWGLLRGDPHLITTVLPEPGMSVAAKRLCRDALAYADAGGGGPEEGSAKLLVPPAGRQVLLFMTTKADAPKGQLKLKKRSSLPHTLFQENELYSLEKAVYGIFSDKDCSAKVCEILTDSAGETNAVELPEGTYYIKEITPPAGHELNLNVSTVTVSSGAVSEVCCEDIPYGRHGLTIKKEDAELQSGSQGNASLKGAEFTVSYYANTNGTTEGEPQASWVFSTDEKGVAEFSEASKVGGDELPTRDGTSWLPLGTYTIQETKAPSGYTLPSNPVAVCVLSLDSAVPTWKQLSDAGIASDISSLTFKDTVKLGGIHITKQAHDPLYTDLHAPEVTQTPSLAEAEIAVINSSNHAILYQGIWIEPNTAVTTITTNDAGSAQIDGLPFGSYTLKEVKAPDGFALNTDWNPTVSVSENQVVVEAPVLVDARLCMATELATLDNSHEAVDEKDIELIDHISYEGLTPGQEYRANVTLYPAGQDPSPENKVASAHLDFTPEKAEGTVNVPITLSNDNLPDAVTAHDEIAHNGTKVASHTDKHSKSQTVHIVKRKSSSKKETLPHTGTENFTIPVLALSGAGLLLFAFVSGRRLR